MTPIRISAGESQSTLKETIWATRLVPTSAPSMMASAEAVLTMPREANEAAINAVAVLLCSSMVMPSPVENAVKRLRMLRPSARRRSAP